MKALVNYARWHEARLRLLGRDEAAVWGQLVWTSPSADERVQDFRFDLQTWELTLEGEGGRQLIKLDEMGVALQARADE